MQKEQMNVPALERDNQGFTTSFPIQGFVPQDVAAFYNRYGLVIFDGVLEQPDIQKTIDDIWTDIQGRCGVELDRHQPATWNFQKWRGRYGFVNGVPLNYPQINANRHNPKVYKAFKSVYELSSGKPINEPLIAMFDRASSLRPGKQHAEWVTDDIYHFDINPWWWTGVVKTTRKDWRSARDYVPDKFQKWLGEGNKLPPNGRTKLAGVLALTDTKEYSGGFECVPGFQNNIKEWTLAHDIHTEIRDDPQLMANFQQIYQRKGSLLIFSRELPHNIYKNLSSAWRFAQYLRMSPESDLFLTEFQKQKRRQCVIPFIPKEVDVNDPIAREVYMMA